jgi:hypothetical protein
LEAAPISELNLFRIHPRIPIIEGDAEAATFIYVFNSTNVPIGVVPPRFFDRQHDVTAHCGHLKGSTLRQLGVAGCAGAFRVGINTLSQFLSATTVHEAVSELALCTSCIALGF